MQTNLSDFVPAIRLLIKAWDFSVVYTLWSFVVVQPIPGFLKMYMRVTDEAEFTEPN